MNLRDCARMGNSEPHHHEDHIAGKGENSLQHYNLVHKLIPMHQAMKIPAAKAVVDKKWEKLEKISAWNLTKVRSKKEVIDEARTSGAKVHFCIIHGHMSFEKCWIGGKTPKIQRSSLYSEVILYKIMRDLMQYSLNKDLQHLKWPAAKIMDIISGLPGCDGQAADAVSAKTKWKWKMLTNC